MEPNTNLFFYDSGTAIYTCLIMVEKELSVSTFIVSETTFKLMHWKKLIEKLNCGQIILHILLFTVYLACGVVWQALCHSDVCLYIFSNCTLLILWLVNL